MMCVLAVPVPSPDKAGIVPQEINGWLIRTDVKETM